MSVEHVTDEHMTLVRQSLQLALASSDQIRSVSPNEHVGDDSPDDSVRDGIGKRHDDDSQEGRDGLLGIHPVDVATVLKHQGTDDHNGRASGIPGQVISYRYFSGNRLIVINESGGN